MEKKFGIIVQSRTGSTRLPKKIFKDIYNGVDVFEYQLKQLKLCTQNDELIVATSTLEQDDLIEKRCNELSIICYRGSELDVMKRYLNAAEKYNIDVIARIPGDNPFIFPKLIDDMILQWKKEMLLDYFSNILTESFPLGLHVELFTLEALRKADFASDKIEEREHVTPYIYNNKNIFNVKNYLNVHDNSKYRLTIDYEEDIAFAIALAERIGSTPIFSVNQLLEYIDKAPSLFHINCMHKKNQSILKNDI